MDEHGVVLSIQLSQGHRQPPVPVEETLALVGHGFDGDKHGKRRANTARQVLLVDRRSLEALGFAPGALREQLTVDLPGLDALPRGTRLRVGEAVLEISGPCAPCEAIGIINGVDPNTLREALEGKRGVAARVVAVAGAGRICRGDKIVVEGGERVPR